ncbi:MAG: hypothetical protein QM690_07130 [Sphingobium sp.]
MVRPAPSRKDVDLLGQAIGFARRHGFTLVERIDGQSGGGGRRRAAERSLFHDAGGAPVRVVPNLCYDGARCRVASVQAPVMDRSGQVAFVLGGVGFSCSLSAYDMVEIGEALTSAAGSLSARLARSGAAGGMPLFH